MVAKTKLYVPTDKDATHLAGMRFRGTPVELTDSQAEHELRIGNIEVYKPPKSDEDKKAGDGKKS